MDQELGIKSEIKRVRWNKANNGNILGQLDPSESAWLEI